MPSEPLSPATAKRLAEIGMGDCTRVAAFALNAGVKHPSPTDQLLLEDGRLNPNRTPEGGTGLADGEINAFLDATTGQNHPGEPAARCFFPRHAVGFFDAGNELIAHYTICFSCRGVRTGGRKLKFVREPDYPGLEKLLAGLGHPASPS
jgi:hypothetical protein